MKNDYVHVHSLTRMVTFIKTNGREKLVDHSFKYN